MHISVQGYKVTLCFAEKENPEVMVRKMRVIILSRPFLFLGHRKGGASKETQLMREYTMLSIGEQIVLETYKCMGLSLIHI